MLLNLNVGVLGHVDSGKTTLCKALSDISSTAAFDKNPQSQERGITLDLGFSAHTCELPAHLQFLLPAYNRLQFTFVDCPGHAKLIRTIIGGAQIIDLMILVVDVTKGIQTQTGECLVIGEITCTQMVIALNKIDQLDVATRQKTIDKMVKRLRSVLAETQFKASTIVPLSALTEENLPEFVKVLQQIAFVPARSTNEPFLFAVDHCFVIRGQGTVCTGTVLQGRVTVNDSIEIPALKVTKKVKSIQMFRQPMTTATQGDRIGICITQFDATLLERGIIARPDYVQTIKAAIVRLNTIKYYKAELVSKSRFHISLGHDTVMSHIQLFRAVDAEQHEFDWTKHYEFVAETTTKRRHPDTMPTAMFALLQFDHSVAVVPNALVIGSKLDMDANKNECRLAFWSQLKSDCVAHDSRDYDRTFLAALKVFKQKSKTGSVQRICNERELIVDQLFKKESNRQMFVGMRVELTPLCRHGTIESTFGSTTKVKVRLDLELTPAEMDRLKQKSNDIRVVLNFRKYLYRSNSKVVQ